MTVQVVSRRERLSIATTVVSEPVALEDVVPEYLIPWENRYGRELGLARYAFIHGEGSYEERAAALALATMKASESEDPDERLHAETARIDQAERRVPDMYFGKACMRQMSLIERLR